MSPAVSTAPRPMRLALYGSIHAKSGSMATAFFAIVREWLRAGHTLDLYSPGSYVDPADLTEFPGFRYFEIGLSPWKRPMRLLPERAPKVARAGLSSILSEAQRAIHEAEVARAILARHAEAPYDALVVLNRLSRFALPAGTLPVVSFAQGSPNGEKEFVRRRGDVVRGECGWSGWALLRAGYEAKDPRIAQAMARSDFIVSPSAWTASMFEREGWPRDRMATLWPPIDLERFRLTQRPGSEDRFTFLWLGRIVPRKRFTLALEALAKLRAHRPGVRLVVIGGPGYSGLVKTRMPDFAAGVERGQPVPNDRVPELMGRTDAVLQPSENENFGASAAEAAACGVPSILGPSNGTAEALDGATFRFDRYEPDAVAAAMERAMDAVLADRVKVAKRARAAAEKNLSLQAAAARAADLVRDVAEGWNGAKRRG